MLGIQKCSAQSHRLNTVINTFIELEKLTLSQKKCHIVHVGKNIQSCADLKVHGKKMENSKQETYLGDKIDKSGKILPTIQSRISRGYGAISNILAITNELPLAHWRVEAGLNMRQAMFLNGTMFNSEAWQGISDTEIQMIEKVDEDLLRGLLKAHSKIPLEALYLETGSIPIRFIIKSRRLSYLHTILQRDSEELVKEVYDAQKVDPVKGDFFELVTGDAKALDLNLTDNEITAMKPETFKTIVKQKVRASAFLYLKEIQKKHSKVKTIKYERLNLANYLQSPLFDSESAQTLLALRTRTVKGIRHDFSGMYSDLTCPLGCGDEDTLPNVLTCNVIKDKHETDSVATSFVEYSDIYSSDIVKQKQVTEMYTQLLQIREDILDSV